VCIYRGGVFLKIGFTTRRQRKARKARSVGIGIVLYLVYPPPTEHTSHDVIYMASSLSNVIRTMLGATYNIWYTRFLLFLLFLLLGLFLRLILKEKPLIYMYSKKQEEQEKQEARYRL
jgi:hypothetical protein